MSNELQFRFMSFVGREFWKNWLPPTWQVRHIARRLMKKGNPWGGADPNKTPLVLSTPYGAYRITDRQGHVEQYKGSIVSIGGM